MSAIPISVHEISSEDQVSIIWLFSLQIDYAFNFCCCVIRNVQQVIC